jgi:hypothetical protein
MPPVSREELHILVERLRHFLNLRTIYRDMLAGRYQPVGCDSGPEEFSPQITMLLVLYAYFYSLIEDSEDAINGFRVLRKHFPNETTTINEVETLAQPFKSRLRVFRNRIGFHGSSSRKHEAPGFELFEKHKGDEIWNAMTTFRNLCTSLLKKDMAARQGKPNVR